MKLSLKLGVVLLFGACSAVDREPKENVVLARHPLKAAPATRSTGESCAERGRSECLGGVCIHTSADPAANFFCTTACRVTADCPKAFTCARLPGSYSSYCTPPQGWTSQVATARVKPGR